MATCEFCKEQMKDGATVCPHCQRATRAAKGRKAGNALVVVALVVLGLFAGLVWIINQPQPTGAEASERIKESCEREFGVETTQANDCRISLMLEHLEGQKSGQMDRARERS